MILLVGAYNGGTCMLRLLDLSMAILPMGLYLHGSEGRYMGNCLVEEVFVDSDYDIPTSYS